jgi:hypothetical protein
MTQQTQSQRRVRIEDLLETVADAVSALVIFSQEAHENKRTMTNLQSGAKGVKAATDYLIQSAGYTISTWRKVGSPEMVPYYCIFIIVFISIFLVDCLNKGPHYEFQLQEFESNTGCFFEADKMSEACNAINQAAQQILEAANELMQDPMRQTAKQNILDAGKNIMRAMVRLLQFNDIYEIVMILRQVEHFDFFLHFHFEQAFDFIHFFMKIEIIRKKEVEVNDTLFPVEEFGQLLRYLSKMLDRRLLGVHDTKVKNMMQQASSELERFVMPLKENVRLSLKVRIFLTLTLIFLFKRLVVTLFHSVSVSYQILVLLLLLLLLLSFSFDILSLSLSLSHRVGSESQRTTNNIDRGTQCDFEKGRRGNKTLRKESIQSFPS